MNEAYEKILRRPRPVSAHRRMPAENRAKLFAPFAALRGFDIAILTKEQDRRLVPRAVPGPDRAAELARVLAALRPGGAVRVTHFVPVRRAGEEELGEYAVTRGHFVRVDGETRELALKEARISLENLRDVEPLAAWEEASA